MKGQSDLVLALEQLEREKGIKKEEILKTVSDALVSALRKYFGKTAQIVAGIDPESGEMMGFLVKKIVEKVNSSELEISLEEAQKLYSDVKIGEDIEIPVNIKDFSRIAAQTAKQVLIQKIREIEKSTLYDEFKPREGEIVTGLVHHIVGRDIFVDLGRAEGVLPYREQIRKEHYSPNERIRTIIHRVEKENRGLQIVLSRASNLFLKGLFEAEVPEIAEKIIEIVQIVREPGFRAKVVVRTNSIKVDPVGACVGMRGSRIRMIMNELSGERIDLIPHTDDNQQMIMRSFAPATVVSVRVEDKNEKKATIIVPDDQLALSIGKDGNNIRLVSRLTGWNLEVKSEGQKQQEARENTDIAVGDLLKVEGLGPKAADTLVKMGITDIEKLAGFKVEDLSSFQGIGEKTAQKIIDGAKKYVKGNLKEVENGDKKE
ncbi:MAG: transcription termination factor NusA [Elusimicrobia bacterium]|nr:transcription termination factor NusA [Elusimicrobiota bacterium]